MLYVYPEVGTTGLCNMLITWARGVIFAREHHAQMIAPTWTNFLRIGPWIRMELDKRLYLRQFQETDYVKGLRKWCRLTCGKKIKEKAYCGEKRGIVVFSGHEEGMRLVIQHRELIRAELFRIANPSYTQALKSLPGHFIGVHVRMGDFTKIGFALKNDYYVRAILEANRQSGGDLPILVFSDAHLEELSYLKNRFPRLRIMPSAPALQDMLALAQADFLVATNRSTFSAWASVLGGMPTYWDKNGEPPNTFLGLDEFRLI